MHYYQHHIGDYRGATTFLTNEEDLAYRRLLDMVYDTELPIPVDTQWVSRRLRVALGSLETVLKDFFILTNEGYVQQRCAIEIAKYHTKATTSRINGSKGGRRKPAPILEKNPAGYPQEPKATPEAPQDLANQEPITNNQEPRTKNQLNTISSVSPTAPPIDKVTPPPIDKVTPPPIDKVTPKKTTATASRFDEFWDNWPSSPRKVGRIACKAKWDRQALDPLADKINASVASLKASEQWSTGFEPAPLTYINQKRWEDSDGTESVSARRVI